MIYRLQLDGSYNSQALPTTIGRMHPHPNLLATIERMLQHPNLSATTKRMLQHLVLPALTGRKLRLPEFYQDQLEGCNYTFICKLLLRGSTNSLGFNLLQPTPTDWFYEGFNQHCKHQLTNRLHMCHSFNWQIRTSFNFLDRL